MDISDQPSIHPYMGISRNKTIQFGDRVFRVIVYGAYNAFGLIGSERNGVVVLDEDRKTVLLDDHCRIESGYHGPSEQQVAEFERICAMSEEEFQTFVQDHPRSRQGKDFSIIPQARKLSRFDPAAYIVLARKSVSHDAKRKAEFLRESQRLAQILAVKLGLHEDQYDIRVNEGGIAVSGDVILHTENLYVNLSQSSLGPNQGFMYRSCKGRSDYTGGRNCWMNWEELNDLDKAAATLKQAIGQ